ncbi:hypothetical protein D3C81_2075690 [compost metagenome]
MHNRRTEKGRAGLDGRYSGDHLNLYTVCTVPAAFNQHLIDQSGHSVHTGIPAGDDSNCLARLRPAHRFLSPADFFGHPCADNFLMLQ